MPTWDPKPATEHNAEFLNASECGLEADGAAATEHSEESTASPDGLTYPKPAPGHSLREEVWMPTSRTVQITVQWSISGDHILGPLRIARTQKTRSLLRQLQHIAYTELHLALLIRLSLDDCILDPSKPLMQNHGDTEHMDIESEPTLEFKMIAEPLLLTWEQLVAMPTCRKLAGRGGKGACRKLK